MKIPIILTESSGIPRRREPVTVGLPLPQGAVRDPLELVLANPAGGLVPVQGSVSLRWPDGTIKWGLFDFQADVDAHCTVEYHLSPRHASPSTAELRGIIVTPRGQDYAVDTGGIQCILRKSAPFTLAIQGIAPEESGWHLEDAGGTRYSFSADRLQPEMLGPLRTTFLMEGSFTASRTGIWLHAILRITFFANSSTMRLAVTLRNPRRAEHPGNHWDLGDSGAAYIKDFSLKLSLGARGPVGITWSCEDGDSFQDAQATSLEIYQDSSGGEQWNGLAHVNRDNKVAPSFRGYRIKVQEQERHGERAQPIVAVRSGETVMAGTIQKFWENCPKAIEVTDRALVMRLFPHQYGDLHELQGGEQKTHVLYVAVSEKGFAPETLAGTRDPLIARSSSEWYAESQAIPYLTCRNLDNNHDYLSLVAAAIDGDDTFLRKREFIDEYGWRNFGDLYADHERVYYKGPPPVVSHYNNQYDAINGACIQFFRSGDPRWLTIADDLAIHVTDIDIYHTEEDRPAYNHGLFWHTNHYTHAFTSAHRAYSKLAEGSGGPSNEHCYTTGLLYHYLLTGNPDSREAVMDLAQWMITTDDGAKTDMAWIDRGYTGYASSTESPAYHGPGRGAGNAINALLDAFVLTEDGRFLVKAEQLIRRCIHPADDVADRQLLDVERRWSYTVFLCALGKYLDCKLQLGRHDRMYGYAQASLLKYAKWMAEHEVPYLTRPQDLEFPTETWSAQDMRKSDVFKWAAKHASGADRTRFLERSEFFFRSSVQELLSAKTRTLTRPVVLMMNHGYMHAHFQVHPEEQAPVAVGRHDFGRPEQFRPQRERALRKVKVMGAVAVCLALAGMAYFALP